MSDLPPSQSRALVNRALRHWAPGVRAGRLLGHGENTVFAVRGRPWVVRVHRDDLHDDDTLRSELELASAVSDAGIDTTVGVRARDGQFLQREDGRVVTVITRVPGRWRRRWSPRTARAMGEVMARLHRFARSWQPPEGFVRPRYNLQALIGPAASWGSLESAGFEPSLVDEVRPALLDVLAPLDSESVVLHFDAHVGNVLWDGFRPWLIDWDDAGFGHPLFDLAIPMLRLGSQKHVEALFEGYGGLSSEDRALLEPVGLALRLRAVPWMASRRDVPAIAERFETRRDQISALARRWLASR